MLLVVSRGDQVLQVFATTPELPDKDAELSVQPGPSMLLHALFYDCPLDVLGLSPGWQEMATSGDEGLPVPRPSETLRATFESGTAGPWTPVSEPAVDLSGVRFPSALRPNNCARLNTVAQRLSSNSGADARPPFGVPLEGDEAFVGNADGLLFRVREDRVEEVTSVSLENPAIAGFRDNAGQIWLFGSRGEIYRGTLESGFVRTGSIARLGPEDLAVAVDGSRGAAPVELFVVTNFGSVDRYVEGKWTRHWRAGSVQDEGFPGVVWLGPGRGIATGIGTSSVFHFPVIVDEHGYPRLQRMVDNAHQALPLAISFVTGIGILVAVNYGSLLVASGEETDWGSYGDGEGWRAFGSDANFGFIRVILPFRDGFLLGLQNGQLVEYRPDNGFCQAQDVTPAPIRGLIRLADSVLVLTRPTGIGDDKVFFMRPSLPDEGCAPGHW